MQSTLRAPLRGSLADTIRRLNELKERENRIIAANDANKFALLVDVDKVKESLYCEILPQYRHLRRDWVRGIITKELYMTSLKPLYRYMSENLKLSVPIEIELEMKKYF